jgi:DNA-directed RNA polymerase specialized sigma24 family protein
MSNDNEPKEPKEQENNNESKNNQNKSKLQEHLELLENSDSTNDILKKQSVKKIVDKSNKKKEARNEIQRAKIKVDKNVLAEISIIANRQKQEEQRKKELQKRKNNTIKKKKEDLENFLNNSNIKKNHTKRVTSDGVEYKAIDHLAIQREEERQAEISLQELTDKEREMIKLSWEKIRDYGKVAEIYNVKKSTVEYLIRRDEHKVKLYEKEIKEKEDAVLSMVDENFGKMKNVFSTYLDEANSKDRIERTELRDLMKVWDIVADKIYKIEEMKNSKQRLEIEKMKMAFNAEKIQLEREKLKALSEQKKTIDPLNDLKNMFLDLSSPIDVDIKDEEE